MTAQKMRAHYIALQPQCAVGFESHVIRSTNHSRLPFPFTEDIAVVCEEFEVVFP